jgi:hypothetical protein
MNFNVIEDGHGGGHAFQIELINPAVSSATMVTMQASFFLNDDPTNLSSVGLQGDWHHRLDTVINAFRVFVQSGNFSGRYRLYGWKAS